MAGYKKFPLICKVRKCAARDDEEKISMIGPAVAGERAQQVSFVVCPSLLDLLNCGMGSCFVFSGNSKSREIMWWALIQAWAWYFTVGVIYRATLVYLHAQTM